MYKSKFIIVTTVIFACALPLLAQSANTDWKGFYAGGNVSGSSDKTDASATLQINQTSGVFVAGRGVVIIPGTTRDFAASKRKTNFSGGFQAGYQWQVRKFVFGGEGDFNPFHRTFTVSQSFQIPPTALVSTTTVTAQRDTRLSREFSLLGRAGLAFGKTMIYGVGGYDNAKARLTGTNTDTNPGGSGANAGGPNVCPGSFCAPDLGPSSSTITSMTTKKMDGWVIGVGIARKFGAHSSIGFEYRHTDLRSKSFTSNGDTVTSTGTTPAFVPSGTTLISLKSDSFGVRVNFHF